MISCILFNGFKYFIIRKLNLIFNILAASLSLFGFVINLSSPLTQLCHQIKLISELDLRNTQLISFN